MHRDVSAQNEATCERLLVRESGDARHGSTLTEAADEDTVRRDASSHLLSNEAVDHVLRFHGPLLIIRAPNR